MAFPKKVWDHVPDSATSRAWVTKCPIARRKKCARMLVLAPSNAPAWDGSPPKKCPIINLAEDMCWTGGCVALFGAYGG